jgi:hypothetical protein
MRKYGLTSHFFTNGFMFNHIHFTIFRCKPDSWEMYTSRDTVMCFLSFMRSPNETHSKCPLNAHRLLPHSQKYKHCLIITTSYVQGFHCVPQFTFQLRTLQSTEAAYFMTDHKTAVFPLSPSTRESTL